MITPAMPMSSGLSEDLRKELGSQYIDVGIAEEQAVAMKSFMTDMIRRSCLKNLV